MKRKDDLFEGLDEFDEEMPDGKRFKMSDDDLGMSVEHALGMPASEDSMQKPSGAFQLTTYLRLSLTNVCKKTMANVLLHKVWVNTHLQCRTCPSKVLALTFSTILSL